MILRPWRNARKKERPGATKWLIQATIILSRSKRALRVEEAG